MKHTTLLGHLKNYWLCLHSLCPYLRKKEDWKMVVIILKSVSCTHTAVTSLSLSEHPIEHWQFFSTSDKDDWDVHYKTPGNWFAKQFLRSLILWATAKAAFASFLLQAEERANTQLIFNKPLRSMLPENSILLPLLFFIPVFQGSLRHKSKGILYLHLICPTLLTGVTQTIIFWHVLQANISRRVLNIF